MKTSQILTYVILTTLAIICIGLAIFVFTRPKPSVNADPCIGNSGPAWVRPTCAFVTESYLDSNIIEPTPQLYLGNFTQSQGTAGGAACLPMWYAFRYVRISDGGYGPLSAWTPLNQPIAAGLSNLPYAPQTGGPQPQGSSTCGFNAPEIVTTTTLDLSYLDGYVLNLHRQVGTFTPGSDGQIVGNLINVGKTGTTPYFTSFCTDVLFPTNTSGTRCANNNC
jgi:hypothetical protein